MKVTEFVREAERKLVLAFGLLDQIGGDQDQPAREREGVGVVKFQNANVKLVSSYVAASPGIESTAGGKGLCSIT